MKFSGPRFRLRLAIHSRVSKGVGSLALLERMLQASFSGYFVQVVPFRLLGLSDSSLWFSCLGASYYFWLDFYWAGSNIFLWRIIRCHRLTPHNIVLAEFGAHPLKLAVIFYLIWFLHRLRGFMETCVDQHRYSHLAYCFSVEITRSDTSTRSRCWYTQTTSLLGSIEIDIDRLPPYQFSLDAPAHFLPSRQELNEHFQQDIYRQYITTTWSNPSGGLRPRMAFYAEHFLEIQNGIVVRLAYLYRR